MTGVSVVYWIGVIAVLLSSGFLIKKMFAKSDDETVNKFDQIVKSNNDEIVNKLDQTLKANNKELIDTLVKLLNKGVEDGKRTNSNSQYTERRNNRHH